MPQPTLSPARQAFWFYIVGVAMVVGGAVCFSGKAVLIKLIYKQYPLDAITLLTLRMAFALPFYALSALLLNRLAPAPLPLSRRDWMGIAVLGMAGYYLASIFDFEGLRFVSAGMERLILFAYPSIVLLWAAIAFKKRVLSAQYVALGLTYGGMALALLADLGRSPQADLARGAAWIFAGAFVYAGYIVYAGRLIPRLGSLRFTTYAMLFATLAIGLHYLIEKGGVRGLFGLPLQVYIMSLAMGVLATVVPTFLTAEGIRRIGSGNAAIIGGIGPMATIGLAYLFLGEEVGIWQGIGTLLVLSGVILISSGGKSAFSPPA